MLGNRLHSAAKAQDCEKLYRSAIDKFRRAARIDNTICEAFFNWVNALFDLSIVKRFGAPEVMTRNGERLLQSAVTKYKRALEIYKAFPDAHNNLANALTDLARSESPKHEIRVLTEALSHYAIAAKTSDTPDVVYCNWGKALHELARRTRDRHAFSDEFYKFRTSGSYNQNHYSTFLSWGNALSDEARRSGSRKLFREAFEKYRRAAKIRPDDTAVYWNWYNEMTALAELEKGEKREVLLREAASIRRKLDRRRKKLSSPNSSPAPPLAS